MASDQLMVGSPPPVGARVTLDNWQEPPYNRWSFQHLREVIPTQRISRGDRQPRALPVQDDPPDLGSLPVARMSGDESTLDDVLAGTWTDPYTARELVLDDMKDPAQARAVQVDHVVPLAEAWVSGAAAWDDVRREQYANDLDALLAVDGPTNASKGSDDPAAWRPRKAYQCAYATRWIVTKSRWSLAESATVMMTSACGRVKKTDASTMPSGP